MPTRTLVVARLLATYAVALTPRLRPRQPPLVPGGMLHRALFGSLERFIGILIENYAGKLPFWISPLQAVVIPISSDFDEYAKSVAKELKRSGLIVEVDLKNHNLNYKIRDHSLTKVPMLLICGKKEVDSNSVTIRRLDSNKQENMALKEFIKKYSGLNKAPSI